MFLEKKLYELLLYFWVVCIMCKKREYGYRILNFYYIKLCF